MLDRIDGLAGKAQVVVVALVPEKMAELSSAISTTAISVSGLMLKRVSGTPIWLLRLPIVWMMLYFFANTAETSSLVVVLPLVPVMLSTVALL